MFENETRRWARQEFGGAELGDSRRTARLVRMAAEAAKLPAGRVSEVFRIPAERQGAYDFLESDRVDPGGMFASMRSACISRCDPYPWVFVPLDGTSLTIVDRDRQKDFGAIGRYSFQKRGMKLIDGMAVSPSGVPLGLCCMQWWSRPTQKPQRQPSTRARGVREKETQHWIDAVDEICGAFDGVGARAWLQIDREGDSWPLLRHLAASGHDFTVRSHRNRRLLSQGPVRQYLRDALRPLRPLGEWSLTVPSAQGRAARTARLSIRATRVTLDLCDGWNKKHYALTLTAVWVREVDTAARSERPVEWMLLTSRPAETVEQAQLIVHGYAQRWRIEDFHKTWKSGVCDVESTQLHAKAHVLRWATVLAAVAVRVEHLKHLARAEPDLPATAELSRIEVDALILLKRQQRKRTETISDSTPTIGQAVLWIAELGGYVGRSSGGPPGSTVIGRGLEHLAVAARVLAASRKR